MDEYMHCNLGSNYCAFVLQRREACLIARGSVSLESVAMLKATVLRK